MEENCKEKFALWLRPETKQMVEKNYKDAGCRSRSDFIEKAIVFYCGYLTATDYREYLPNIIVSTMKGNLDSFENRMANLLFKSSVELSMLLHVIAATHNIDGDTLENPRSALQVLVRSYTSLLWCSFCYSAKNMRLYKLVNFVI